MRVLHIVPTVDYRGGGVPAAARGMAESMARNGLNVGFLASYRSGENLKNADELRGQGMEVNLVGPCSGPLRRHPKLISAIEQALSQTDVVHVHGLWEEIQFQTVRIAHERRLPYVISPHGMLDPWSLKQSRLKKRLYLLWRLRRYLREAAGVHLTSQTERDHAVEAGFVSGARAIVEPLGIDLREFQTLPAAGTFRQHHRQLGSQLGNRKVVSYLGRIHREKGLELLVPALAQMRRRRPDIDAALIIIGPDSQGFRAVVEQMIRSEGAALEDRVLFTGLLTGADRVAALRDSDLFALPSFHENFGLAIIEALACGVPALISDQVNIHQEVSNAQVGVVTRCQVDQVSAELERWLSDDGLRLEAGRRARSFACDNYDWSHIAHRWTEHYRRLIAACSVESIAT